MNCKRMSKTLTRFQGGNGDRDQECERKMHVKSSHRKSELESFEQELSKLKKGDGGISSIIILLYYSQHLLCAQSAKGEF
jgi:hypothetical protein